MNIQGKVAIVTGSGVRLGRSIALALAEADADVCIHYRNSQKEAEEVVRLIKSMGRNACSIQADLSDSLNSAKKLIQKTISHFGSADILVNNASLFEEEDFGEISEGHWDSHFSANLKSPFFLSQEFVTQRATGESGHIINIVDWRATRPGKDHLVYTLTKAGLVTLTQSLALELAPNIQVNGIAPGAILPPPGETESYLEKIAGKVPLQRSGNPQEIVNAVLYLLQSDFVTGEIMHVTGGQNL